MILSGKSRIAGVLGWPVSHSRSPRLQNHWLERYEIDGAYIPLPVRPESFASAVTTLASLGFCGANVTVPHKEAALRVCDEVTSSARRIGAVNTLFFEEGRILGDNTDAYGFIQNLFEGCSQWQATAGPAVVLGAGGAARALCVALLDAGAPEIRLVNRTKERADRLADSLRQNGDGAQLEIGVWGDWDKVCADANLLVNATSLGMTGQPALGIDLSALPTTALVNDIVYTPLETELLATARQRGNRVVDGLGMLLHQAVPGFSRWFGQTPDVDEDLRRFVLEA
ncbi:shikimate dehydrogenase [Fodinicurvata halophila]|uniref:Shikimate dehydrogenase (NADP(+)) n=1 Tax=Fodinicurvata halophila TaxID=1419723 RepID=A0ABV8UMS7_9PROT